MRRYDREMNERLHFRGRPFRSIRPHRRPIFFVSPRPRIPRGSSTILYVILIIFLILFFISFLIMCFLLF